MEVELRAAEVSRTTYATRSVSRVMQYVAGAALVAVVAIAAAIGAGCFRLLLASSGELASRSCLLGCAAAR
jgi:hypothetical protein